MKGKRLMLIDRTTRVWQLNPHSPSSPLFRALQRRLLHSCRSHSLVLTFLFQHHQKATSSPQLHSTLHGHRPPRSSHTAVAM